MSRTVKPRRDNVRRVALERMERGAIEQRGVGMAQGKSPVVVDQWRFLLGPLEPTTWSPLPFVRADGSEGALSATVLDTMESFKVKPERLGEYVPFLLRPHQLEIHRERLAAFARGEPCKQRILKTRRYGLTTYDIVESVTLLLRIPGWHGATLAKDDEDAKKFFRIVRETFKQVPDWVLADLGLQTVTFNRNTLTVRHANSPGGFMESSYTIFTANSDTGVGRGATYNKLHPTEPPHYNEKAKADYASIQPSLGAFPGNVEVWESTACGFDAMFEPGYRESRPAGTEYDPLVHTSKFVKHFIPAYAHPNFYQPFRGGLKEAREFAKLIGDDEKFGGSMERFYLEQCVLPYQREGVLPPGCLGTAPEDMSEDAVLLRALEQIAHRRTLVVDQCAPEGHPLCCQEFPFTEAEAFRSTGNSFFDQEKIEGWEEMLRRRPVGEMGEFFVEDGVVVWEAKRDGRWLLREPRRDGLSYCWGADTASGVVKHADGRTEGDFPTCTLGEVETGRVVAVFHAHVKPDEHAHEIAKASCWFGWGPGYAERAVTGDSGTMLTNMERLEVCGRNAAECVLHSHKEVWSDDGPVREAQIGYTTRVGTKKVLLDQMAEWWDNEVGPPVEGEVSPVDAGTLSEMRRFRRVQSSTGEKVKLKGVGAHDDLVLSLALMLRARRVLLEETPERRTVFEAEPEDPLVRALMARTDFSDGGHDEPMFV